MQTIPQISQHKSEVGHLAHCRTPEKLFSSVLLLLTHELVGLLFPPRSEAQRLARGRTS